MIVRDVTSVTMPEKEGGERRNSINGEELKSLREETLGLLSSKDSGLGSNLAAMRKSKSESFNLKELSMELPTAKYFWVKSCVLEMYRACDVEDPVIIQCFRATEALDIEPLWQPFTFMIVTKMHYFCRLLCWRNKSLCNPVHWKVKCYIFAIYLQIKNCISSYLPSCESSSVCKCYAACVADP